MSHLLGLRSWSLSLLACGALSLSACDKKTAPTATPDGINTQSWDLFYRTAAKDLECDAESLAVERKGGATFSAKGCGKEIFYGVFYENASGPVILSDLTVRRKAAEIVGVCEEDPPAVYYYDDHRRNVHGCGKVVIVVFVNGGWAIDHSAKPPI